MAILQVQQNDNGTQDAALVANKTVTYASGPTEGNVLVACSVATNDGTGLAMASAGWTAVPGTPFGHPWGTFAPTTGMWYKVAGAGETTTVQVSVTNTGRIGLWVAEYSGIDPSDPLDVSAFNAHRGQVGTLTHAVGLNATPHPSFLDGLHLQFYANSEGISGTSFAAVLGGIQHNAVSTGGVFGHRFGSDTTKAWGSVYHDLGLSAGLPCCGSATISASSSGLSQPSSISAIFKATGAAASNLASTHSTPLPPRQTAVDTSASDTSARVDFWSNVVAGSLVYVILVRTTSVAVTMPAGWTQIGADSTMTAHYKRMDGSEGDAFTFSWTGAAKVIAIGVEYENSLDPPLDSQGSINNHRQDEDSSTVAATLPAISSYTNPSVGSGLGLAAAWMRSVNSAPSGAAGFAEEDTNGWTLVMSAILSAIEGERLVLMSKPLGPGYPEFRAEVPAWGSSVQIYQYAVLEHTFKFQVGGSDHWSWAEGSDDMDGWG